MSISYLIFRFERTVSFENTKIQISILDTAGQEGFSALRSSWVTGRDAFILCLDATNPDLESLLE